MRGIIAGDRSIYDKRIQERLCSQICLRYDVPFFGGIPVAKPFQCLHLFHPQCVTNWKKWGLIGGNDSGPINTYFFVNLNCVINTKKTIIMNGIWMGQ